MIVIKKGPIDYTRYNRLPELTCAFFKHDSVAFMNLFEGLIKSQLSYANLNDLDDYRQELCLTIEKQFVKLLELFDKGEVYLYDQDTKEFEKIIILPGKKPTNMSK